MDGTKEQTAVFDVTLLPLFIFTDGPSLPFILVCVCLVLLQPHELTERVNEVLGKAKKYTTVCSCFRSEGKDVADDCGQKGCQGKPPAEEDGPKDVEYRKPF